MGEHDMKAITNICYRAACVASITTLILSGYACARESMYAHVEPIPEAVIAAEDAVQVPIQNRGTRDRAAKPCEGPYGDVRTPGSRVVGCGPAEASRVLLDR